MSAANVTIEIFKESFLNFLLPIFFKNTTLYAKISFGDLGVIDILVFYLGLIAGTFFCYKIGGFLKNKIKISAEKINKYQYAIAILLCIALRPLVVVLFAASGMRFARIAALCAGYITAAHVILYFI